MQNKTYLHAVFYGLISAILLTLAASLSNAQEGEGIAVGALPGGGRSSRHKTSKLSAVCS